jgi:putative component of membrane protein insertase Oxa1/YidC/SpoIIIJ protein YidD
LVAISAYQRFVSPYKGFGCAYRVHTGCQSCSVLGYRAIRRFGVIDGVALLRQRFGRCTEAYQRHHVFVGSLHRQRGLCDLSCDLPSCDLPCDIHKPASVSDAISCCDCSSCDCGSRRKSRRKEGDGREVYIPPQRRPAREPR